MARKVSLPIIEEEVRDTMFVMLPSPTSCPNAIRNPDKLRGKSGLVELVRETPGHRIYIRPYSVPWETWGK